MASRQRQLLTASTSKLGKVDITRLLEKDEAWALLPEETRRHLYTLLPAPSDNAPPPDPDVHPLNTQYRTYIKNELRRWQTDLTEGREVKKWREEAMKAGRDRAEGQFDEWKDRMREDQWGLPGAGNDENIPPKAEADDGNEDEPGQRVGDGGARPVAASESADEAKRDNLEGPPAATSEVAGEAKVKNVEGKPTAASVGAAEARMDSVEAQPANGGAGDDGAETADDLHAAVNGTEADDHAHQPSSLD